MHSYKHGVAALLAFLTIVMHDSMCAAQEATYQPGGAGSATNPALSNLLRAYPRYSFYTAEAEGVIVCEIGLPGPELAQSKLAAKDARGKTIAEIKGLRARTMLPVPIRDLPAGRHPVTVELQREPGEVVARQEAIVVKRSPRPGCEWKIDLVDKVILNNGQPFFPFGIMAQHLTTNNEEIVQDVAGMGFNTVVRWSATPLEKIEDLLELARKYDFYVVDFPGYWRYNPGPGEDPLPPLPQGERWSHDLVARVQWDWLMNHIWLPGIKRIADHPRLVAYYLRDEPQKALEMAAAILRFHNKIYELDGYHPTEVLYIPPVPEGDEFSRNCDILGTDIYWIPGGGKSATDNPLCMARFTWATRRRADRDLKLAWITPCAEQYSVTRLRLFTEQEQRVQTYLALIHGAKGLLYFVYPFKHQSTAETFKRLGREMKVLGPACAAPEVPQVVRYAPVPFEPLKNVYPDVHVALMQNPAGGYILLAANWKKYPVDVTYRLSLPGEAGSVSLLFNREKTYKVDKGSFTDSLSAMDTRAYAIEAPDFDPARAFGSSGELSRTVEIAVDLKAHPDKPDPFYMAVGIPESGAPGNKNLLRNSSFEECHIPGMPDYYKDIRTPKTKLGYRQGDPRGDCGWSIDATQPYDGKASLRLQDSSYSFLLFGIAPKIAAPTQFVFSVWARSESATNTFLRFYGPTTLRERYPLSTQWQRFSQVVTVGPDAPWAGHYFGFYTGATSTNNVWIDAMQFEMGTNLTEYAR